jgi:hypothetical protein
MAEFVRYPIPEELLALNPVIVDEHGARRQVSEHVAGVTGGHVDPKDSSIGDVLPIGNKDGAQEQNVGLHFLNQRSLQGFLGGCRANDSVVDRGLRAAESRNQYEDQKDPNASSDLPPPPVR